MQMSNLMSIKLTEESYHTLTFIHTSQTKPQQVYSLTILAQSKSNHPSEQAQDEAQSHPQYCSHELSCHRLAACQHK